MVLASGNYLVIWCSVGTNGRASAGGVWNRRLLNSMIKEGDLLLPPSEPLPFRSTPLPYIFVGDDVFPLKFYLIKPFAKQGLDILILKVCL